MRSCLRGCDFLEIPAAQFGQIFRVSPKNRPFCAAGIERVSRFVGYFTTLSDVVTKTNIELLFKKGDGVGLIIERCTNKL